MNPEFPPCIEDMNSTGNWISPLQATIEVYTTNLGQVRRYAENCWTIVTAEGEDPIKDQDLIFFLEMASQTQRYCQFREVEKSFEDGTRFGKLLERQRLELLEKGRIEDERNSST